MIERTCSISGCDRRHCARGLCRKHYNEAGHGFMPSRCRVPGCPDMTTNKTGDRLCVNHYGRMRRHGSTDALKFKARDGVGPAEILWMRSTPRGDCVLWDGALKSDGYGSVGGKIWGTTLIHRFSWMLVNGPIAPGMEIDHTCHSADPTCEPAHCLHRRCVNPDHLEMVTRDENMRRQFARPAFAEAHGVVLAVPDDEDVAGGP